MLRSNVLLLRLSPQRPRNPSSFLSQIWTSNISLQRAKILSYTVLRHNTKAIIPKYSAPRVRSLNTDSKSADQAETPSSAFSALSAQLHELIAIKDYSKALQLLKDAQVPIATFPLALLKDALSVFLATHEYERAMDCGILIFELEDFDSDIGLLHFLVDFTLRTGKPKNAIPVFLKNKVKSLLVKHGRYTYGKIIENDMPLDEAFAFIASLEDKKEAIGILTIFATVLSALNSPADVVSATQAILRIDPTRADTSLTLLSAYLCQASADPNICDAFARATSDVHKSAPGGYCTQFTLEAGKLQKKYPEIVSAMHLAAFMNGLPFAIFFAPWYLEAVMKLEGPQKVQEKLVEFELESVEKIFLNPKQTLLGKVQTLQYLREHDRPLMERLLYEHLLIRDTLDLRDLHMMFGLSLRLAEDPDLDARIRFLETLYSASRFPNLWNIKMLAEAYFEKKLFAHALHYLMQIDNFDTPSASDREKMFACADALKKT